MSKNRKGSILCDIIGMALHIWDSLTLHSEVSLRRKKNRPQKEKIWTRRVLCWGDWGRVWLLVATSDFYVGLREHGHEVGVSWGGQYTWGGPCLDGWTMLNFRSQTQSFIAKTPSLGSSFHNDSVLYCHSRKLFMQNFFANVFPFHFCANCLCHFFWHCLFQVLQKKFQWKLGPFLVLNSK